MFRRLAILSLLSLALPLAANAQQPAVPGPDPQTLIEQIAQQMLDALDADRDAYKKDPQKVNALVDRVVLELINAFRY